MLNERERLLNILTRKGADRPAVICPGGMMNMIISDFSRVCGAALPHAHTDSTLMARLAGCAFECGCFENVGVPFCMTVESEAMGARCDLGTALVEPRVVEYVISSCSEYGNLPEINVNQGRIKTTLDAIGILKNTYENLPIIGNITGPISCATSLLEPTIFYKELRKNRENAHKLLNFITNQLISFALAQIDAGANVIAISDPSGTGEILGPKYFEEFAVTYINKIVAAVKSRGVPIIVHICGNMRQVYEQVNHIESDALSFDSIVPIRDARAHLPERVLMGNVSTYALEFGTPEKIGVLTRECARNGSDILAPACGLGMGSKLENVRTILSEIKEVYHEKH